MYLTIAQSQTFFMYLYALAAIVGLLSVYVFLNPKPNKSNKNYDDSKPFEDYLARRSYKMAYSIVFLVFALSIGIMSYLWGIRYAAGFIASCLVAACVFLMSASILFVVFLKAYQLATRSGTDTPVEKVTKLSFGAVMLVVFMAGIYLLTNGSLM